MEIWHSWLALLQSGIAFLHMEMGLSEAAAVITFTLLLKALLMPLSVRASFRSHKSRLAMKKLAPQITRIKETYKDAPDEVARRTMALYKQHGIRFIDKFTLFNMGSQGVVGLGLYHTLRNMGLSGPFLWIANIAKPNLLLVLAVAVLTAVSMALMPAAAEQSMVIFAALSALMAVLFLIHMPSILGLYWATSNVVTLGQSLLLRQLFAREAKQGV